eukprot:m.126823 g.126823  ORF g.126823 m.126823 type:complete len:178 (-) comp11197_c0_seq1:1981-2514(-)
MNGGGMRAVTALPVVNDRGEILDAQVTGYKILGDKENRVTMYTIAVVTDVGTYEVRRRYSEFRTLRDNLKRALPSETFHFPAKKRNPLKDNFGTAFLQKRQQNLNEFITRVTRDSRCAKLKLVQSFFFDSPQGRGANKVGDALPLGPESPDNTMFMDETMDPLEVRRASSACKIFVD